MSEGTTPGLHVVVVGVDLDPPQLGRPSTQLVEGWRDLGHLEAAIAADGKTRVTLVQASWTDARRVIDGTSCHFVREPMPFVTLPGGRAIRRLPRRLIARVKELAPDIIHFNGLTFPRELRALQAAVPQAPIVAQDHGFDVPAGWRRWYCRWGLANLHAVIVCARDQAKQLEQMGLLDERVRVFEALEVSSPFEPGDQQAARSATGLRGQPCLLWLGNLDANKDPLTILDAVAMASAALPAMRLYMCFRHAGLIDEVRARIAGDQRLAAHVELIGEVPHPRIESYLRAADFLVQGSHREVAGFGVIEALACGTTPIVTDIPSFRRITGGGAFGALVPVHDAAALARAIVEWSGRDQRALRQAARQHFEGQLSFRAVGEQLRRIYWSMRATI